MFLSRHLLYCVACYCALLVRVALQLTDSLTQFAHRCRHARFSTHDPLQPFLQGQLNLVAELERIGFLGKVRNCQSPIVHDGTYRVRPAGGRTDLVLWERFKKTRRFLSFLLNFFFLAKKLIQSCCLLVNMSNMNISQFTRQTCQRNKPFTWPNKSTNKAATPFGKRSSVFLSFRHLKLLFFQKECYFSPFYQSEFFQILRFTLKTCSIYSTQVHVFLFFLFSFLSTDSEKSRCF